MSNKIADLQKTIKKNKNGYNYKYADLAAIHEMLAGAKISYWQETIVNPPQAMGGSISYSRRYSLLLILGLATEDDDAESLTRHTAKPAAAAAAPSGGRVSFDDIREKIKDMRGAELESYKAKILAQPMTYKQKDAIKNIFEKRRAEIMAQNMGFKPKES